MTSQICSRQTPQILSAAIFAAYVGVIHAQGGEREVGEGRSLPGAGCPPAGEGLNPLPAQRRIQKTPARGLKNCRRRVEISKNHIYVSLRKRRRGKRIQKIVDRKTKGLTNLNDINLFLAVWLKQHKTIV